MREDGWLVVDVREPYEREAGRIPGTRHIEMERLASQAESIPRDRPVVFQCRLGARSGLATRAFRAAGWEAFNLRGGIQAWVAAGLVYGLHLLPRPTRLFLAIMSTTGVAELCYSLTEALDWNARAARRRCT